MTATSLDDRSEPRSVNYCTRWRSGGIEILAGVPGLNRRVTPSTVRRTSPSKTTNCISPPAAVGFSLIAMLVYLWFRFELIYGAAAVVAVFHDTLITVGAFSLTNKEISLTVVAAILTLVGYSMNDTIVVFDRIRENVKLLRRESLAEIVNRSINQTLSRTILTSGLTFLTVLSLYLFGGEVLRGFSFALVIGIIIGTYSSIAVAAPMLVAYQEWRSKRSGSVPVPAATGKSKARVKV